MIIVVVVAVVGIGVLSAIYVSNNGNQDNHGSSLPPISGVTVNVTKPRYVAQMGYMITTIYVTNNRSTYMEIYNDTYVATLSDGSKLTGYYEGSLSRKIAPGSTGSFVIKFDSGTWVDIVSIRFADESGYFDAPVPQ